MLQIKKTTTQPIVRKRTWVEAPLPLAHVLAFTRACIHAKPHRHVCHHQHVFCDTLLHFNRKKQHYLLTRVKHTAIFPLRPFDIATTALWRRHYGPLTSPKGCYHFVNWALWQNHVLTPPIHIATNREYIEAKKRRKEQKNVTRKCDNNTVKKVIFHDGITNGSVTYQNITLALESIVFENSNAIANLECFNNGTLKDVVLPKNI